MDNPSRTVIYYRLLIFKGRDCVTDRVLRSREDATASMKSCLKWNGGYDVSRTMKVHLR